MIYVSIHTFHQYSDHPISHAENVYPLDLQLSPGAISSKLCCVGAGAGSTAWTAAATEAAGAEGAARAFSNFASGDSGGSRSHIITGLV